jgi:glycosyl transferase family 25
MQAIFVINLENRTDRRIAMQEQLLRVGWHAEFFSAIRPDSAAGFPSVGARGCFLSHLSVLKIAQKLGVQRAIILEDDVNFVPDFRERWISSISALVRQEWSVFYPGHVLERLPEGVSRLPPTTAVRCTHFMVINRIALSALIHGLETILSRPAGHILGGPMHVDGAYSTIRRQDHSLATFVYSPALGYQRPSRTDVGDLQWFDRVSVLTPIVNFARKLKSTSKPTFRL